MIHSRVANWILACTTQPRDREAVLGDLAEEYEVRRRDFSSTRAALWYWDQVCRSVLWFLWTLVYRHGWFTTLSVAVAACLAQALIETLAALTIRQLFPAHVTATMVLGLVVVVASLFVIAYVAARVRPGAGMLFGLIAAAVLVARSILAVSIVSAAQLAGVIAIPSAAFAGAALSLKRHGV